MNHFLDTTFRFPIPAKVSIYPFASYRYSIVRKKPFARKGKELAKQKPDFREGRPKKFNQQQINLAMNLLEESHFYKEVEQMIGISKSTMTHHKRKQIVMTQ